MHLHFMARYSYIQTSVRSDVTYSFLTVAPYVPVFLHKIPQPLWKFYSCEPFHQVKVSAAYESSHPQCQQKHRTWEIGSNKSSDTLGGNRADNQEGQRRFPSPELSVGSRRGERGSVPWGAGNKPDTSKSLHMGNLSGRGTSLLLGRISCESGRLITIVGMVQFRWQKCLCLHFCCQT